MGCLAAGYLDGALEALAFHLVVAGADNGLGVAVGVGDTDGLGLGQFDGFLAFGAIGVPFPLVPPVNPPNEKLSCLPI